MMRARAALVAVVFLAALMVLGGTLQAATPRVVVDRVELKVDTPPILDNDRLLVPLRAIFAALGASISWDDATSTVTAVRAGTTIQLTIGSANAYRNGAVIPLSVPARAIDGRTMVPLRFVSEALGCQVGWDDVTQTATIQTVNPTAAKGVDPRFVGTWSSREGMGGELVEPSTGMFVRDVYSGSWYLFRDNGTYRYVIIGSGQFISGAVVSEGNWAIKDNTLMLTNVKDSWFPDPSHPGQREAYRDKPANDEILPFKFVDGDTLQLGEYGNDIFYRYRDEGQKDDQTQLLGTWATKMPNGELWDPNSCGEFGDLYTVSALEFDEGGFYSQATVISGTDQSGLSMIDGVYSVSGIKVTLTDRTETWLPAGQEGAEITARPLADVTMGLVMVDKDTIKVGDVTYYRLNR